MAPSKKLLDEKNLIVDRRAAYEFPEPRSFLASAVSSTRNLFYRTMLPVGYPETVHPNYIKFNFWSFLQGVVGSASGVLSTQCLLVGLGMAGGSSSLASGGGTIALAATLNWVLKDGIGNLGGILFVSKYGGAFDRDAKRYRFLSALSMNLSTVLEMIVPLVPHLFLPLASIANTCKSVSWMASSATKAQILRHFTDMDNLADLTGKAASLNTAAGVCGTGLGVLLSSMFLIGLSETAAGLVSSCLAISLPLMTIYLWANYKSCLLSVSPRLTMQRIDIILRSLATAILDSNGKPVVENINSLSRYIRCPTSMGKRERFLYAPWRRDDLCSIQFEPPVSKLAGIFKDDNMVEEYMSFFDEHGFVAAFDRNVKLSVWFSDKEAPLERILVDLLSVYLARILYEKGSVEWLSALKKGHEIALTTGLIKALKTKQWELENSYLPRRPIVFKSV